MSRFPFCGLLPSGYSTLGSRRLPQTQSLEILESRLTALLAQISELGDFRPGSITATTGRCGNPRCHCHQPGATGHGPNYRLTFRRHGKTVTESFPNEAAKRKAQREIAAFRQWQQLSRELVEVNTQICQLRPVEETLSPQEKKRPKRSSRKSLKK